MTTQRFNPFPRVNGAYGAPMGRRSTVQAFESDADLCVAGPAYEYDAGGAYWGDGGNDGPVWAVWERGKGRDGVMYVRALSRKGAVVAAKDA